MTRSMPHLLVWLLALVTVARAGFYTPDLEHLSCTTWVPGSVLTWGDASFGGNAHAVESDLYAIKQVVPTQFSFSAVREDGEVITWGNKRNGGKPDAVAEPKLHASVKNVHATNFAFAALRKDGAVVAWGDKEGGGNLGELTGYLAHDVREVVSNEHAFAAIKMDGSVATWGSHPYGGNSESVADKLHGVVSIQSTYGAFAALRSNGAVVAWGDSRCGGDSSKVNGALQSGVTNLFSTFKSFAALTRHGRVVTWGDSCCGGDSDNVGWALWNEVRTVVSNWAAFAAIKSDGSVVTWGNKLRGGDSSKVQLRFAPGVLDITATIGAFTAHVADGSFVKWGDTSVDTEHYTTHAGTKLTIFSTGHASAALINSRPDCPNGGTTSTTTSTTTTTTITYAGRRRAPTTTMSSSTTTSTTPASTRTTMTTRTTTTTSIGIATTTTSTATTTTSTNGTTTTQTNVTTTTSTTTSSTTTTSSSTTLSTQTLPLQDHSTTSIHNPGMGGGTASSTLPTGTVSTTRSEAFITTTATLSLATTVLFNSSDPMPVLTTTTLSLATIVPFNSSIVRVYMVQAALSLDVSGPADLASSPDFLSAQATSFSEALPDAQMVKCYSIEECFTCDRRLNVSNAGNLLKLVVRLRFFVSDLPTVGSIRKQVFPEVAPIGGGFVSNFTTRLQHEGHILGLDMKVLRMKPLEMSEPVLGMLDLSASGLLCTLKGRFPCPAHCQWNPEWGLCIKDTTPNSGTNITNSSKTPISTTSRAMLPSVPPVIRSSNWIVSDWGECSSMCGSGEKQRAVFCDVEQASGSCGADNRPSDVEECDAGCELVGALGGGAVGLIMLAGWRIVVVRRRSRKRPREIATGKFDDVKDVNGKAAKKKMAIANWGAKKPHRKKGSPERAEYSKVSTDDPALVPSSPRNTGSPNLDFDDVPDDLIIADEDDDVFNLQIDDPCSVGRGAGARQISEFEFDLDDMSSRYRTGELPFGQVPDRLPAPEDDDEIFSISIDDRSTEDSSNRYQSLPRSDRQQAAPQPLSQPSANGGMVATAQGMFGQFLRTLAWGGAPNLEFDDVPDNIEVPSEDGPSQESTDNTWSGLPDSASARENTTDSSRGISDLSQENTMDSFHSAGSWNNPPRAVGPMAFQDVPEYLDRIDMDEDARSFSHSGCSQSDDGSQYSGSGYSRSVDSVTSGFNERPRRNSNRASSSFHSTGAHMGSDGDEMSCDGTGSAADFDLVSRDLQGNHSILPAGNNGARGSRNSGLPSGPQANADTDDRFSFFSAIRKRLYPLQETTQPQDDERLAKKVERLAQKVSQGEARGQFASRPSTERRRPGAPGSLAFADVPESLPVSDSEEEASVAGSSIASLVHRQPELAFDQVPDVLPVSEDGSESHRSIESSLEDGIDLDFDDVPDDLDLDVEEPAHSAQSDELGFADVPDNLADDAEEPEPHAVQSDELGFADVPDNLADDVEEPEPALVAQSDDLGFADVPDNLASDMNSVVPVNLAAAARSGALGYTDVPESLDVPDDESLAIKERTDTSYDSSRRSIESGCRSTLFAQREGTDMSHESAVSIHSYDNRRERTDESYDSGSRSIPGVRREGTDMSHDSVVSIDSYNIGPERTDVSHDDRSIESRSGTGRDFRRSVGSYDDQSDVGHRASDDYDDGSNSGGPGDFSRSGAHYDDRRRSHDPRGATGDDDHSIASRSELDREDSLRSSAPQSFDRPNGRRQSRDEEDGELDTFELSF